jgi:uncharacterized membrane protein YphA (DoxX/SURF4 family)
MNAYPAGAAPLAGESLPGSDRKLARVGLALRAALASPFLASGLLKARRLELGAGGVRRARHLGSSDHGGCGHRDPDLRFASSRHSPGAWLGAGVLAVFTMLATLIAHPFWLLEGADRVRQLTTFLEHVAIVGGLAAVAFLAGASPPAGRAASAGFPPP